MKPYFITTLSAAWDAKEKTWTLVDALAYHSELLDRIIEVPRGFETDLASVPRLPFIYLVAGGKANAPAVIHDFLYQTKLVDRKVADAVFDEAMKAEGDPWWRRKMMWAGVRLFGWIPYENSEDDIDEKDHPATGG